MRGSTPGTQQSLAASVLIMISLGFPHLSLIYYITNYATKDDVSPWQMVAKAALLKQRIERAETAELSTRTDLRLREKGSDNFALCCFNTLTRSRNQRRPSGKHLAQPTSSLHDQL